MSVMNNRSSTFIKRYKSIQNIDISYIPKYSVELLLLHFNLNVVAGRAVLYHYICV